MPDASPQTPSKEQALQNLFLDPDLERLEDLLAEFNLFDVLKIQRQEAQHSAFLAWLLNPRGSHGLGDYFLRKFLSQVAVGAYERKITNITPLHVDGWDLNNVEVATERHNIDILIISDSDEFVCLIENKIGAAEHSNQLARYFETVEREYQDLVPFPIFLTPEGRDPQSEYDAERYVPFDYDSVAVLIERTLKTRGSAISGGVADFLAQYARTLRRHVLDTTDNIDELALKLYAKHRTAIDLIINAKPLLEVKARDIIEKTMMAFAPSLQPDFHSRNYCRFYSPHLDEIQDLKEGTGWTSSGRILLFEVWYRQRRLVLQMGPGPNETRNRIFQLVQRTNPVPGVDMRRSSSLRSRYHPVYSKSLFPNRGSNEPDYEENSKLLEQTISNFYNNDYWPIVNAIRNEFGLQPVSPASE